MLRGELLGEHPQHHVDSAGDRSAGAQGGEASRQGEGFVASLELLGAPAPGKELLEAKWAEVVQQPLEYQQAGYTSTLIQKEASTAAH